MPSSTPTSPSLPSPATRRDQAGPPLLPPALAFTGLSVAGLVLGAGGPRPTSTPDAVAAYLTGSVGTATLLGVLVLAAAFPLAIWTAVTYRRLRGLGVTAPGPAIGLVGGLMASCALAVSGLVAWTAAATAALPGAGSNPGQALLLRALSTLSFAAGGPWFVASLGLLLAGTAVPALILGLLPRSVAWVGLGLAVIAVAGVLSLLFPVLSPLLPIGRFGGALWMVTVSLLLPVRRARRTPGQPSDSPSATDRARVQS